MSGRNDATVIADQVTPFPVGGGELARLIRDFDWSTTSLGPLASWPQYLKTATDICLRAPTPIVMLFGPDGFLVYNDAYAVFAGHRHPSLLGAKVLEAWPEAADLNRQVLDTCLHAGKTLSLKDQPLILFRLANNAADELWVDLDYSPIPDETGKPAGVFAIVVETTRKVLAEQALAEERFAVLDMNRRLTAESSFLRDLFEQAPSFMCMTVGPDHAFALANRAYQHLVGQTDLIGKTVDEALPGIREQGFISLLDEVYATGAPFLGSGTKVLLERKPDTPPEERYIDFIYAPIRNAEGDVTGIFTQGQDVTERLRGEQHQRLLINELNHRVKNTLAMIQSVAMQTFRNAGDIAQAQAAFSSRIMALARANDLLTGENWEGASLGDVIASASASHAGGDSRRFSANGPVVRLSPKAALSVSMAMHELATNAVKYGALSNDNGRIAVTWSVDGVGAGKARLHLEWRESGGPPVTSPARRGFGSRLIERGLAGELGGTAQLNFEPAGLVCVIDAPLPGNEDDI